ncbi:uncharacterized protein [Leptinotarsa decemlineata]|uniref:uncharacterized protein n=1 Tax=Leptinotarsa decemlineata TaxID=7539 RepID=UPI003D309974
MSATKRLRFTSDDDLCLLREVVGQNPLQNPEKWNSIQANIKSVTGKEFVIRTLKDHVMLLLTLWKKKSDGDKFRSGTEEMYTEKDTLLQEISDACAEFPMPTKKTKVISKEKQVAELGRQTRENIAIDAFIVNSEDCSGTSGEIIISGEHDYFDPNPNLPSTEICVGEVDTLDVIDQNTKSLPTAKKSTGPGIARSRQNKSVVLRRNAMEYLKNKNEKEQEIKLRELQLQEQKLKLHERSIEIEEKRLQMEIEDRKKKIELEFEKIKCDIKQRSELQAHISAQQTFLDTLLKRLQKYED